MTRQTLLRTVGAMNETVISVQGLTKRYGDVEAVRGVDLDVRRGEIFAFLGPNGAGKTITVEILEGFRTASSGTISVLGVDPAHAGPAWRNRVGAVLQESQAEPGLTVRECLEPTPATTPSLGTSPRRSPWSGCRRRRTRSAITSRVASGVGSTSRSR